MKRNKNKKIKKFSRREILFYIFLIVLICLMIHPIQLFKNNLLKPMSVALGDNIISVEDRYYKSVEETVHKDISGKEYSIEHSQNYGDVLNKSYEAIVTDEVLYLESHVNDLEKNVSHEYTKSKEKVNLSVGEAYILAHGKGTLYATDKTQQAIWTLRGNFGNIENLRDSEGKTIVQQIAEMIGKNNRGWGAQAAIESAGLAYEANVMQNFSEKLEKFKEEHNVFSYLFGLAESNIKPFE